MAYAGKRLCDFCGYRYTDEAGFRSCKKYYILITYTRECWIEQKNFNSHLVMRDLFFSPPSFFINWTWVFFPPGVCLQVLSTAYCYTHLCHPLCSDWILLWLLQPFKSNSYLLYIPKYVDVIFFCYSALLHDSWFKCPQPRVAPASFSE